MCACSDMEINWLACTNTRYQIVSQFSYCHCHYPLDWELGERHGGDLHRYSWCPPAPGVPRQREQRRQCGGQDEEVPGAADSGDTGAALPSLQTWLPSVWLCSLLSTIGIKRNIKYIWDILFIIIRSIFQDLKWKICLLRAKNRFHIT